MKTWEKTFNDKIDEIMEKYPKSISNNSAFAAALKEYGEIDTSVMSVEDVKKMRTIFVNMYLKKMEHDGLKEDYLKTLYISLS